MTFNSMLEHLLHGEFDVDPGTIGLEGSVHDRKTYTYFGIIPALLRLPLLPIDALMRLDVTRLYCALAATVALCFKLASVALINDKLPKSRLQAIAFFVIVLSLLLGGAQIQFLRGSIYQETIEWAGAIAAAFVYCAVRGLIAERGFSTGLIAVMAALAGLGLLTRVSIALGLYVATGLLILVLALPPIGPLRDRLPSFVRGFASKRTVVGFAILLGFATVFGIVNLSALGRPAEGYRRSYRLHPLCGSTRASRSLGSLWRVQHRAAVVRNTLLFRSDLDDRSSGRAISVCRIRDTDARRRRDAAEQFIAVRCIVAGAGRGLSAAAAAVGARAPARPPRRSRADDRSFDTGVSDTDVYVHGL